MSEAGHDVGEGGDLGERASEEVDAKICEQIKPVPDPEPGAGVFPVRLAAVDWTSGDTHWLLDVIAPTQALVTSVLANMQQVVKDGDLRIHPVVTRLVEDGALEKLGASRTPASGASNEDREG